MDTITVDGTQFPVAESRTNCRDCDEGVWYAIPQHHPTKTVEPLFVRHWTVPTRPPVPVRFGDAGALDDGGDVFWRVTVQRVEGHPNAPEGVGRTGGWQWWIMRHNTATGAAIHEPKGPRKEEIPGVCYDRTVDVLPGVASTVERRIEDETTRIIRWLDDEPADIVDGLKVIAGTKLTDTVIREWTRIVDASGPMTLRRTWCGHSLAITRDADGWAWEAADESGHATDLAEAMLTAETAAARSRDDLDPQARAVVEATVTRNHTRRLADRAEIVWRQTIRAGLADGDRRTAGYLARMAGVTPARIYQIRDNTR